MDDRAFLRRTVATLAYRVAKAVRDAPPKFASLTIAPTSRAPVAIVAHLGDLFDWALSIARGQESWHNATPLPWDEEVRRFFAALQAFDDFLAGGESLARPAGDLFQGPVADALTHTGQLTMLRRLAGSPIKSENYSRASIVAGVVGSSHPSPNSEF